MKMGKLFSSIATATMVLTTLAPAAVANAATGYPLTDDGVSQTQSSGASLPAATYNEKNSRSGSVQAKSDASVNVIDGYLVLQSVPNFGFGAAIAGNTADLVNYKNAGHGANDASESGLLTILDSRHSTSGESGATTSQDGMGFVLTLGLSQFSHNGTTTSTRPGTDLFSLDFVKGSAGLREQYNKNNISDVVEASPITIKENSRDNTLITSSKKSGGKHTWAFTGRDVKLNVPPTAAEGQWYATMTWTLKSQAV